MERLIAENVVDKNIKFLRRGQMKAIHLTALAAVLLAGCMPADPEERLYKIVQSDRSQAYTIYNYPSVYLTSGEQQVRGRKQAESVRDFVTAGMSTSQLAAAWGRPNNIKKSTYPGGTFDTFIYESTGGRYNRIEHYYFVFRDKKLESWHKA